MDTTRLSITASELRIGDTILDEQGEGKKITLLDHKTDTVVVTLNRHLPQIEIPSDTPLSIERVKPADNRAPEGFIWSDKRLSIMKALHSLRCFTALSSRTAPDIAPVAGVEPKDVTHYLYKDEDLCKSGYTSCA
jgi:hypothetical protein